MLEFEYILFLMLSSSRVRFFQQGQWRFFAVLFIYDLFFMIFLDNLVIETRVSIATYIGWTDRDGSVQPMYTVVDGDAIAFLQYLHPTASRTVVSLRSCSPRPPGLTAARLWRRGSSGPRPPKPLPSESGDPTSEGLLLPDPPQHQCWFSR